MNDRESSDGIRVEDVPVRVLYLTADLDLIARQLCGERLSYDPDRPLLDNVSTDEIAPAHACFYYDERLGEYALTGLRGGAIGRGAVAAGGFGVLVSGRSKGCGSSRETAPYAELFAGVRMVVATSFEKIYLQNCQNVGLVASTDFTLLERLECGFATSSVVPDDLDPLSRDVVAAGGLVAYTNDRIRGRRSPPRVTTAPRPMTLGEAIIARHTVTGSAEGSVGVPAVRPGDAVFVRADVRFTHDYVTAMADSIFRRGFGEQASVTEPESVYAFRDHLTLLSTVMPAEHKKAGLDSAAAHLAEVQRRFASRHRVRLYDEVRREGHVVGSEGICHNIVVEEIALPGQVVVGTDSHTCTAGALGCFAFGVGSTDMACAWRTGDVRLTVPETVRIDLTGELRPWVTEKDVMLHVLGLEHFTSGHALSQVIEWGGAAIAAFGVDQRATLTNMAVEAGAITGIVEPDETTLSHVRRRGGLPDGSVLRAHPAAEYAARLTIPLETVEATVATPGDPRNAMPLSRLLDGEPIPIDIAYGGSCTGGKATDLDLYAAVLREAARRGLRVPPHVRFFIQFGSQRVRRHAEARGYDALFRSVGVELLDPSCGACIRAGPGVSVRPGQVTISATNRNFPGRSGPGNVYLASPLVVAASAIFGQIVSPERILS